MDNAWHGLHFPRAVGTICLVGSYDREIDLVESYAALVFSADATVRERAAREWCAWEDTHVSLTPGYAPSRRLRIRRFDCSLRVSLPITGGMPRF